MSFSDSDDELRAAEASSTNSTSRNNLNSASSLTSNYDLNILITGSKCTGKTSLCQTLILLLGNDDDTFHFDYIDVNHLRQQCNQLSVPLNKKFVTMVRNKLNDGFVLIEDTNFDIYYKTSFSVIFILKTDDEILEKRLIKQGDFHTPYNDFHIMEPYNSVCEKFPFTKQNIIYILDNSVQRHLEVNARFIKKWIDEFINPPDKNKLKFLDSDGETDRSDTDDSDANETLIHRDGKFKMSRSHDLHDNDNSDD